MRTLIQLLFARRETYRVHGAAHPATLKARRMEVQMERLRQQEAAIRARAAKHAPAAPDMLTVPTVTREITRDRSGCLVVAGRKYQSLAEALAAAK